MTLTERSSLREVVKTVSRALRRHRIEAILTGGASASLHTNGDYVSHDLDYILRGRITRTQLDDAMATIGFSRTGVEYRHGHTAFFVEFPAGPLAIGNDDLVEPVEIRIGGTPVLTLSATDSCRDRLAAFYHWNDLQSLRVAVAIARHQRVDVAAIRAWSTKEGRRDEFRRFQEEAARPERLRSRRRP